MHFLIIISLLFASLHPVHVSFTNVEYNEDKQELLIASRIFWNDMELSVKEQLEVDLGLGSETQHPDTEQYIEAWFVQNFKISINGKAISPDEIQLDKTERSEMAMRVFLSLKTEKPESLKIENQILTELFADQSNLLIINISGEQQSFSLTGENNVITLEVE
ncbi:MAG: hypothetical protein PF448_13845 [Bacteroidales bacterium]|jgi:hypothetical protein|nr:hypothetical protein [Bacteroidales bacterium]